MNKLNVVVFTGAGISAESGISTFRDKDGLWDNYDINDVATPRGWRKNPQLVLDFYDSLRKKMKSCDPNDAHKILATLEVTYNIHIITQNVDDLHERGGSTKVLHLHGELNKVRSEYNSLVLFDAPETTKVGDLAEDGGQLRPHIVWFGEGVPALNDAINIVSNADIFVIIGTSLQVYPASSLVEYSKVGIPIIIINPENHHSELPIDILKRVTFIEGKATEGVKRLAEELNKYSVSL